MSNFEGFEYNQSKKLEYIPPVKSAEDERISKIDNTLEEVIYNNKHKNKRQTEDQSDEWHGGDYDYDYRLKDDRRVHYVTLRVPRNEIEKLCSSLNINTKGYFVKMEAVLTKRHH
ncbi:hypothetical protein M9Y10_038404 [Tritrichomonas musculus]|uniref:Uncharacterized protein n=1 Tax=Tritrichomonas musculus TaxID=1915356 RepID=A0ABR2K8H4_9EUKA